LPGRRANYRSPANRVTFLTLKFAKNGGRERSLLETDAPNWLACTQISFAGRDFSMSKTAHTSHSELHRLRLQLQMERASRQKAEADLKQAEAALGSLRTSETYFRHLTEYALDLITILDADGTIRFESRSIATELGYEPTDYVGKNAFDFVHPEDAPRVMQAFLTALQSHGSTPILSFRFRHKDGSYRILEGRGNNLLDAPAVAGIVFNSRDVTDQRRLEEQFRQSQKVQAIGQLTGGVAHDFNNILTAIIGYSDLALAQVTSESLVAGLIEEVNRAAQRAAGLTRQLLAFSRKQVLQPKVINLETVIAEMDKMLRRLLGEQVELSSVSHPSAGNVKADLGQIEQVLLNLAVNARDAMPMGGRFRMETRNVTLDENHALTRDEVAPGEYVLLAISDTGCGMTPEVKARLFEPFFTTKEIGKGTGLGLATCHGIVKQSGGHISACSEVGKGTTFKIYLPRVNEKAAPLQNTPETVEIPAGSGTVLFVEDEPMLRELGLTVLNELGYRVFTAENGKDALALIARHPDAKIDLLLTDVVMPEMGGKELVERLRPLYPHTKVIYCSGYTEDAIFHNGGLDADVHFLQKPYTVAAVAQKVRDVMCSVPQTTRPLN
jgi:two-component system cell cycle sensor histidine kinase/response regulator CckA